MHSQRVILLFNVRRANPVDARSTANHSLFDFHNVGRTVPTRGVPVEIRNRVGFYNLAVIDFTAETAFNGLSVSG